MMWVLIMRTLPWSNSCGMFYRDNVQSLTLSLMKTSIRLLPLSNNVLPEMVPAVQLSPLKMYQLYRTRHELVLFGTQAETGKDMFQSGSGQVNKDKCFGQMFCV